MSNETAFCRAGVVRIGVPPLARPGANLDIFSAEGNGLFFTLAKISFVAF